VFENRVLRRIFGQKRDEMTAGNRKLHNEELHCLCTSPNMIRMKSSRMGRTYSTRGIEDECIQGFGRKTGRKEINRET
jgi:hypothetical protein